MLCDEAFQNRNGAGFLPELELGIDALLDDRQPQLVQPAGLSSKGRLMCEVAQSRAVPEAERRSESFFTLASRERPSRLDEMLEPPNVDRLRPSAKHVAPRLRDDDVLPQVLAEPRNMAVQGGWCIYGLLLAPEVLDQPVAANDLVGLEDEEREHGAPLRAPHLDDPAVAPNFEWPEHPKLQHFETVTPSQSS